MKFRYKKFGPYLRPVIPVTVKNASKIANYEVLVDSGADLAVFDAEIGDAIGLDVTTGTRGSITGIAGQNAPSYAHKVEIEVGGWSFETDVAFMPQVGEVSNYGVVGQIGLFENFVVKFDYRKGEVELKPR
ncbi:MAG: aspartyl protease family protein [Candidatus Andersenbacteria bacterium]